MNDTSHHIDHFSVGLNGAPFSPDFALVKWTDTSNSALASVKFMGFTTGERGQSLQFGANCVLLKTQYAVLGQSPYVQVSPQQIQALQYQQYQLASQTGSQYQLASQASSQYKLAPQQYQGQDRWAPAPSKHPADWVQLAPPPLHPTLLTYIVEVY
jgi:hypothetical protein